MGACASGCRSTARVAPHSKPLGMQGEIQDSTTARSLSQLSTGTAEMVYILGGAGVGKSTWVQQSQLSRTHQMIDPDRIVGLCPIDDANPGGVDSPTHRWCKQQCNELLEEALKSPRRQSFVLVGTGKSFGNKAPNKHPKVQLMRRATQMGFRTRVIFLHCPVDVARERNASRPRSLPDELVVSTMESSRRLYELLRAVCDVAEERDTSAHESFRRGRKASLADVDHQMVAWLKDLARAATKDPSRPPRHRPTGTIPKVRLRATKGCTLESGPSQIMPVAADDRVHPVSPRSTWPGNPAQGRSRWQRSISRPGQPVPMLPMKTTTTTTRRRRRTPRVVRRRSWFSRPLRSVRTPRRRRAGPSAPMHLVEHTRVHHKSRLHYHAGRCFGTGLQMECGGLSFR